MAILSSKDLLVGRQAQPATEEQPAVQAPAAFPPPEPKARDPEEEMRMTFVLPFAAPGVKTMAAFYDDKGVEVQLPLDGQKYVVVEPDANKRASLKALLCKNGFLLAGEEPAEAKPGPAVSKEEIILAHPDGYVDAEFTVNFGRKQHVVKLEGGRFGTLDLKLVKHLIEKGFTVQNPHAYERALEAKE